MYVCMYVCHWSIVSIGLTTERLRVRLSPGPLQATLSKLLTCSVPRLTQPPVLSGAGNEYSSLSIGWATRRVPSWTDWGDGTLCLLLASRFEVCDSVGHG